MPNSKMVNNKRYKGIENITDADKELVKLSYNRWKINRHNPNKEDIKLLFTKYHEYVYKNPSDMACPSCVQMIFDYWGSIIAEWCLLDQTNQPVTDN